MEKEELFFVGIYGRLQLELIELGVIDSKGIPYPKPRRVFKDKTWRKLILEESYAKELYIWVGNKIKKLSEKELNEKANYTNKVASEIINGNKTVNNFLLSLNMLAMYLDEYASFATREALLHKIHELVNFYDKHIDTKQKDVILYTYRVADNMYRIFTNKKQLSDSEREALFNKIKGKA